MPVDLENPARRLAGLVATVADEQLNAATPCPAYTIGDLVDHIGGLALAFTAAAQKDTGPLVNSSPSGDGALLTDDWRTRIVRDLDALIDAWRKPDAWEGMTRIASMDAPAEMVGLTVADELVVHGWDLATATGRDYDVDPDSLAAARQFLDMAISPDSPAGDTVAFGPGRPAPAGATPLEQAIALAGRDPAWTAKG